MVRKRLIVSLLWRAGVIVQSVQFRHTNVVGDPKVAIEFFNAWDADEIILLDVTREKTQVERFIGVLQHVSNHCFLPLTAGGWIDSAEKARRYVENGADKVVINTEGHLRPALFTDVANLYGSQCVVASIDVRGDAGAGYSVSVDRGRQDLKSPPERVARQAVDAGAGEIFLTSVDRDGSLAGYDLELIRRVAAAVDVPVIAFGGVGKWQDLVDGLEAGAEAVAAGNIFHFTEQSTRAAKHHLRRGPLPVR
jgi:cyclase